MKKQIVVGIVLLQLGYLYTEFTLQIIENKSDLKFGYAYYISVGKEKKLPSLSDTLQNSNGKQHVVIDKKVGSDGLAVVLLDNQGHQATIFMHDQTIYSLEYKRKKTQKITSFPDITPIGTGPYVAQVIMKDRVDGKMVAKPIAYQHIEDGRFNLLISGSQGQYHILLQPTA